MSYRLMTALHQRGYKTPRLNWASAPNRMRRALLHDIDGTKECLPCD